MIAPPAIALVYSTLLASIATNYSIFDFHREKVNLIDIKKQKLTETELKKIEESAQKTTFYLYTRSNPLIGQQLLIDNLDSVKESFWNPAHPTRLVTHGWLGNSEEPSCTQIRDAYLKTSDYNVIAIDWREAATLWKSVPHVSQRVASLINFLKNNAGLNPNKTTMIGFSLGAHVVSLGARFASSEIGEVVALDPPGPKFESEGPGKRVDKSDAAIVQVIHTCIKCLSMKSAVGTSDFYLNGGEEQPGCGPIRWIGDVKAMICSHSRAFLYYAESIVNPAGFRAGNVFMGGLFLDPNARGTYFLRTASKSPFALG
ncbi:hypothetical protein PUN28_012538 [Cardiocondyla obscurior]|uniref:phospholipase A1 n=1 Tax=Cardiocondyla obscurior TaxID=286306 RepID=A0AAW2FEQ5_9HYME